MKNNMKILTVVGARPQFIKAATLSRSIKKNPSLKEVMVHTGQHFDTNMSETFFKQLGIPEPAYNLGISCLNHGAMTGRMIEKIEEVLLIENPKMVIVFGDTNSTLAGSLAAKKTGIPVAHVEAGLRSFDMNMPEEINRVVTDRISDLLFCPTETAFNNLIAEGYQRLDAAIHVPGDIMYDSALYFSETALEVNRRFEPPYVICTIHRQELVQSLDKLKITLDSLVELNNQVPVVLITHPRTNDAINEICYHLPFQTYPPLGYFEMLNAIKNAECVITDSGGMQKEAYFLKRPCITLRNNTEWIELVDAGVNMLAKNAQDIVRLFNNLKNSRLNFDASFYGEGNAADLIVETIVQYHEMKKQ
jgi:UDP-GlcNAc3NAcA epimerase